MVTSSGDDLAVVTDLLWNRIVYASQKGNWVKSYGDNPGDAYLYMPRSVSLDQFGNILVLAGRPTRITQLKYNESSGSISFVGNIPISGVQQAVDICFDDNFTPSVQGDDSFWLADMLGNAVYHFDLSGHKQFYSTEDR